MTSGELEHVTLLTAGNAEDDKSFSNLFERLCRALESTESEHDEHADTIRRVLKTPGFDVNRLEQWGEARWDHREALHVACDDDIRTHIGAQLLLSDERCDVNIPDNRSNTAMMFAVRRVTCTCMQAMQQTY